MSLVSCQAVINDRLPMMDEVERGFKEKYEERMGKASGKVLPGGPPYQL